VLFERVSHHYRRVGEQLEIREGDLDELRTTPPGGSSQTVIVPVEGLDRAVLRTIEYARSSSQNVTAVHITDDVKEAETLRAKWEESIPDVPIVIVESPYRALVAPFLAYVDAVDRANPQGRITVVLPEFVPAHGWQSFLHNQPATRLRRAVSKRRNTAVANVLYQLR
jgi:nucleotide-binding universal stress UspA family protein